MAMGGDGKVSGKLVTFVPWDLNIRQVDHCN